MAQLAAKQPVSLAVEEAQAYKAVYLKQVDVRTLAVQFPSYRTASRIHPQNEHSILNIEDETASLVGALWLHNR